MIARGQMFSDVSVVLDGSTFIDCRFERCVMQYSGLLPVHFGGNSHFDNCHWQFTGPADNTIGFLRVMYAQPAMRPLIEAAFNLIRGKPDPTQPSIVTH